MFYYPFGGPQKKRNVFTKSIPTYISALGIFNWVSEVCQTHFTKHFSFGSSKIQNVSNSLIYIYRVSVEVEKLTPSEIVHPAPEGLSPTFNPRVQPPDNTLYYSCVYLFNVILFNYHPARFNQLSVEMNFQDKTI